MWQGPDYGQHPASRRAGADHAEAAERELLSAKTDQGNDPLLARWQAGLGRTVAFTSGMWRRWGPGWLNWDQFDPRWAQIVRWAMRKSGTTDLDVQARIEEGKGKIVIDAVDKSAGYINFLEFAGSVIDPDLKPKPLDIVQTGPGHYEATFDADTAGSYILGLQYKKGKEIGFVQTGVASSYSPEYASLQANPIFLDTLATIGKGEVLPVAFDPQKYNVFRRDLPEAVTREPAWPTLLAIALAIFLLDVAVRRIAIDPRAVVAGARGWLGDLAGRWRTPAGEGDPGLTEAASRAGAGGVARTSEGNCPGRPGRRWPQEEIRRRRGARPGRLRRCAGRRRGRRR